MQNHPTKNGDSDIATKLENAADRATEVAREQAEAVTQTATDHAETKVSNAADAAAAAAGELEQGSMQEAAAQQIATHLQDAAELLRETDFNGAATKAKAFARENPMLFLGGAALMGFAAVRFLKASDAGHASIEPGDTDPWMGHVTSTARPDHAQGAPTAPTHRHATAGVTS